MRIIDVLNLVAEGKIEDGQKLVVIDERGERYNYVYMLINGGSFICNHHKRPRLAKHYPHSKNILNLEVELID